MTYLQTTLESAGVRKFITAVILFNAVILGLETSTMVMARFGTFIGILDRICLAIFVVELVLKLLAYRFRFFRDGWNIFDFAIVAVSLVPAAQSLSVLRSLRILRILRVVSVAPRLRRVVEGFITALPGMASVFLLMGIIFYIGSVISTKLFGADFPQWFGSLGQSAYSLFQIMTLESWSMGIVRPVMEVYPTPKPQNPYNKNFYNICDYKKLNINMNQDLSSVHRKNKEKAIRSMSDQRKSIVIGKNSSILILGQDIPEDGE